MHGVYFFSAAPGSGWRRSMSSPRFCCARAFLAPRIEEKLFLFHRRPAPWLPRCLPPTPNSRNTFVVWNANVPEETFWYLIRERGNGGVVSMILIAGKFFIPFFGLLPEKLKINFKVIIPVLPLDAGAGCMRLTWPSTFIRPGLPTVFALHLLWLPLGCLMFMGRLLRKSS